MKEIIVNTMGRLSVLCGLFVIFIIVFNHATSAEAATVLSEGFEGAFPGSWSVGDANSRGTAAYWDDVDSAFGGEGTHGGSWKGYVADNGNAGNSTSPAYQNSMSAYMKRNIDLTGSSSATLSFWYKIPSIEANWDYCRVFIGSTKVWERSASQGSWTQVTINLNSYAGSIRELKFQFDSDSSVTAEGWYIDDILVTKTSTSSYADLALQNLTVSRPSNSALRTFTGVGFDIRNYGPAALVNERITTDYYLSNDTTFGDADDKKIGDTGFTVSIASGATYHINLSSTGLGYMVDEWTQNLVASGNYYVFASVRITSSPPTDPTSSNNYDRTNSTISYTGDPGTFQGAMPWIPLLLLDKNDSKAIIVAVDGLSFVNTLLSVNLEDTEHYLKSALESMNLGVTNSDIVSFDWSRDANDTAGAVEDLRELLRIQFERAEREKKKFIVVGHSWGTFLSYMALSFESTVGNPIHCDLFITLGSPLGTYYAHDSLWWEEVAVNGYVNEWLFLLNFSDCADCYPRTNRCVNYWAWEDVISGPLVDFTFGEENIRRRGKYKSGFAA
jgi:hypothetical protein